MKKIRLNELERFVKSSFYNELDDKPISLSRMKSYINNPNASDTDVVLFMAFDNKVFIGYKTVFSDTFNISNKNVKFGWLSGTWTHNDYRRKGVSTLLLKEVIIDWDDKLMYTNYAEESKAVYDKSKEFEKLKSLNGYRFYIRSCFKELLQPKHTVFMKNKNILGLLDSVLNVFIEIRLKFYKKEKSIYKVEKLIKWDNEICDFLNYFKEDELFKRTSKTFNWVDKFPWINTDLNTKSRSKKYYFSSYSNNFESTWYKVYNSKTKKMVSVFLVIMNGNKLKVPYIYSRSNDFSYIREFIFNLSLNNKISYFTIYSNELNKSIKASRFALWSKKFNQNYYSTNFIFKEYPEIKKLEIQSGDGDVIFT